jgi:hypothetical protein
MWLEWEGEHTLVVNVPKYITSQPVEYCQIKDDIDLVRRRAVPVHAYIDVSELIVTQVDLIGLIDIIWELHENTRGDPYLQSITFTGASRRVLIAWRTLSGVLPEFVTRLIRFE